MSHRRAAHRATRHLGTMRALVVEDNQAVVRTVPLPTPKKGHRIMRVHSAGLNRADILQTAGKYAPPKGASSILGLEASGYLEDGTLACGLVSGGALAEHVLIPQGNLLYIPSLSPVEQAAIPEAFLFAHHLLFQLGNFTDGQTCIIHAAGSGIGTALIQLASLVPSACIIATSRTPSKLSAAKKLGATVTVNTTEGPTSDAVHLATGGEGAHLILDCIGAAAFRDNARAIRKDGKWLLYGLLSGAKRSDVNLVYLLQKRINLIATTLRARDDAFKARLASEFTQLYASRFASGELRAVVAKQFDGLERAAEAMRFMENNENFGKIIVNI